MGLPETLKLKNQICFPLYSVSNLILRNYKPLLDKLDLTYTQYITMMVLWEKGEVKEKELGQTLHLRSNTLAPLLKKLERKGYIEMRKHKDDGRSVLISPTKRGEELQREAINIPQDLAESIHLSVEEATFLYNILNKILKENYHEEL